jgi:hypothetical protein
MFRVSFFITDKVAKESGVCPRQPFLAGSNICYPKVENLKGDQLGANFIKPL